MGSIVVIAASTGGLEPLRTIMSKLPVPCVASIFVVWHIGQHASVLPSILSSASKLPARFAQDNARIEPGHIYVAPPDHHVGPVTAKLCELATPNNSRDLSKVSALVLSKTGLCRITHPLSQAAKC